VAISPGTRLGRYEVVEPLGSGGMGEVYRARDLRLERDVAVKVLSARLERDEEALERFLREARAVAALSHPNIVSIHDFATHEGRPYAVTELLDGEPLRARIARGPLPWREAAELAVGIADGLAAAHARGIVHRDLKPENLFLTRDGRVKILDFGLARSSGVPSAPPDDPHAPTMASPSDAGRIVGTVGYMSPEQARGLAVGPPSDIFSLGCVLYELVTGRRAFARATPTDTIAAVLHDPPAPLSETGHQFPPELARIVHHCLEKDPERRFQSARDLVFTLHSVLNDSSAEPAPRGRKPAPRTRSVAVMPFANDSGDADLEYLSDGITETLINALAQVPRVRVVPRATVFRYKGRVMDPPELGVELNASALVTGRLVSRDSTVTVQADLTDTTTHAQLWGERYSRPATDLMALQESLAEEIAGALRGRLSGRRTRKPAGAATSATAATRAAAHPDSAAYEEYLRGRYESNKWTAEGFRKAVQHHEAAVTRDPAFAPAWAGIAEAVGAAVYFGYLDSSMLMRSRLAAQRAIELAPNLAEAHAVGGMGAFFYEWDFAEARRAFERALSLNPHLATTHVYYSLFLASQGEFDQAVREAQAAERLDPVAPITMRGVAWAMQFAGHDDRAIAQLHRILDLEAGSAIAHGILMWLHEMRGEFDAAISHVGPWMEGEGLPLELAGELRRAYDEEGPRGYWRARLAMIERSGLHGRPVAFASAYLRLQLGEREEALKRLQQSVEQRLPALVFLAVDRSFRALHGDPRFEALRQRIGLPAVPPRVTVG